MHGLGAWDVRRVLAEGCMAHQDMGRAWWGGRAGGVMGRE